MNKQEVEKDASWLGARLREPSTYAGLAVLLTGALGIHNADNVAYVIMHWGMAMGGIAAIVLPEGASQ